MLTPVIGTRRRSTSKPSENPVLGKGADVDAPQFEPGPIRSTSLSDVDVSETSSEDDSPAKERAPSTTRPAPTMSAAPRDSASWMEVDPSIALALAVPLGSWPPLPPLSTSRSRTEHAPHRGSCELFCSLEVATRLPQILSPRLKQASNVLYPLCHWMPSFR